LGIIVARRKIDGKSGHIVAVVPETDRERAKKNREGLVTAALQSQAGSVNFRYGRGRAERWAGEQFADSAFGSTHKIVGGIGSVFGNAAILRWRERG
jgi:hypothetical protein